MAGLEGLCRKNKNGGKVVPYCFKNKRNTMCPWGLIGGSSDVSGWWGLTLGVTDGGYRRELAPGIRRREGVDGS